MDLNQIYGGLTLVLILLTSLCIHEWAHAFVADMLGDSTPHEQGRVTLNPAAHIDPIGTLFLPLFMVLFGSGMIFGWGRPVMTQPSQYKCGARLGDILVSLAGPASNVLLGIVAGVAHGLMAQNGVGEKTLLLVQNFMHINALLAGLNLLPIPPLDGFHVLRQVIRMKDELYIKITQFGFVIVLLFFMVPQFRIVIFIAKAIAYLPMQLADTVAANL